MEGARIMDILNHRPCMAARTDNVHFLVGFDPQTAIVVKFFITGRGKVGQQLDTELYELSVKASKLMQGEPDNDLPRMQKGNDRKSDHECSASSGSS